MSQYSTGKPYEAAVTFLIYGYGAYAAGFELTARLALPLIEAAIMAPKRPEESFRKDFSEVPYFR